MIIARNYGTRRENRENNLAQSRPVPGASGLPHESIRWDDVGDGPPLPPAQGVVVKGRSDQEAMGVQPRRARSPGAAPTRRGVPRGRGAPARAPGEAAD